MTQKLLCLACANYRYKLTEADKFNGYEERVVQFELRTPARHGFTMMGRFTEAHDVSCDNCHETIFTGSQVVAVTTWKARKHQAEKEPDKWEWGFGAPITEI